MIHVAPMSIDVLQGGRTNRNSIHEAIDSSAFTHPTSSFVGFDMGYSFTSACWLVNLGCLLAVILQLYVE